MLSSSRPTASPTPEIARLTTATFSGRAATTMRSSGASLIRRLRLRDAWRVGRARRRGVDRAGWCRARSPRAPAAPRARRPRAPRRSRSPASSARRRRLEHDADDRGVDELGAGEVDEDAAPRRPPLPRGAHAARRGGQVVLPGEGDDHDPGILAARARLSWMHGGEDTQCLEPAPGGYTTAGANPAPPCTRNGPGGRPPGPLLFRGRFAIARAGARDPRLHFVGRRGPRTRHRSGAVDARQLVDSAARRVPRRSSRPSPASRRRSRARSSTAPRSSMPRSPRSSSAATVIAAVGFAAEEVPVGAS